MLAAGVARLGAPRQTGRIETAGREGGKRASKAYSEELEKGAGDAGEKAGKKYAGAFETNVKKSIEKAMSSETPSKFVNVELPVGADVPSTP